MAYTPELTPESSCTLRRLAWAAGLPMTKVINQIFEFIPQFIDKRTICGACRDDSRCKLCGFSKVVNYDDDDPPFAFTGKQFGFKEIKEEDLHLS